MRIGVAQLGVSDSETVADRTERVLATVANLPEADLWVLPELWATGAWDHTALAGAAEPLTGPLVGRLRALAAQRTGVLHAGSLVESSAPPAPGLPGLYNTAVVCGPQGQIAATYRKIHRFGVGEGSEADHISAGETVVTTHLPVGENNVPVGLATCYDLRFPELFRALMAHGAELVVVVAAWPAARLDAWRLLVQARAVENQCVMVAVNATGSQRGVQLAGHSMVVGPDGAIIAEGSDSEETWVTAVNFDQVGQLRQSFGVLGHRRFEVRAHPCNAADTNRATA